MISLSSLAGDVQLHNVHVTQLTLMFAFIKIIILTIMRRFELNFFFLFFYILLLSCSGDVSAHTKKN